MDFFVVPAISFRLLYGFLNLQHSRRQLLWLGVTARPNAHWIARQLTEAYGWQQVPRYIVRDRDCVYGAVVVQRLRAERGHFGLFRLTRFAVAGQTRRDPFLEAS